MALRARRLAETVLGIARRESTVATALRLGAADEGSLDPASIEGADLVVLATPLSAIVPTLSRYGHLLSPGALVTDLGSVKGPLCVPGAVQLPEGVEFIGGHPLCGSEESGPSAAREDLYEGAVWVLTPGLGSPPEAVSRLAQLAEAVGARPLLLDAVTHDRAVAASSHLPHLTACALAAAVGAAAATTPEVAALCAGGFRDGTRVSEGSPEVWRDILLANRDAVLEQLYGLSGQLAAWTELLQASDGDALAQALAGAGEARRALLSHQQG
ncbi:MAG TPA: prephenate dehydrogenase/arogenate dehydrogenase family protein [Armatimonadota bacterium]